jgi:ABC-type transport system involved in multi-copper enzyme maturation permease subunit
MIGENIDNETRSMTFKFLGFLSVFIFIILFAYSLGNFLSNPSINTLALSAVFLILFFISFILVITYLTVSSKEIATVEPSKEAVFYFSADEQEKRHPDDETSKSKEKILDEIHSYIDKLEKKK